MKSVDHLTVRFLNVILFVHFCDLYFVLISDRDHCHFHHYDYYCISHFWQPCFYVNKMSTPLKQMALCAQLSTEIKYIRQYINAEARFNLRGSHVWFCGRRNGTAVRFPRVFRFSQTSRHPSVISVWFTIDPPASVARQISKSLIPEWRP